jgi:hypothetical protein
MPRYPDDRDADPLDDRRERPDDERPYRDPRLPGFGSGKVLLTLVGCGCLVVLGCGGVIAVGAVWGWKVFTEQLPQATGVADQFLDRLQHGDVEAAYEMTTRGFRERDTRQQFADFVQRSQMFTTHTTRTVSSARIFTNQAGSQATVVMTLHSPKNAMTCTLLLVEEGDEWKVDRVTLP